MAWVEERCPTCGGPLPGADFADVLVCKYCHAELRAAPGAQYRVPPKIDEPPYEPALPRVAIAGVRYVVLGQLAEGTSADIFLARRDVRLTARGWHARILQHEIDHLHGTLCVDRMDPRTLSSHPNYSKFWRGHTVADVRAALHAPPR